VNARGFTLIELLVSTVVVLVVAGVITALSVPMRRAFDRGLAGTEIVLRSRTAMTAIVEDARAAGSGVAIGPAERALADILPIVVPLRSLGNQRVEPPFEAVTLTRATGAQGLLRDAVAVGAVTLTLDPAGPCTEQDATCRLRPGDSVVVLDDINTTSALVSAIDAGAGTVLLTAPVTRAFDRGAVIVAIERITYGLRADPIGLMRLVRVTAGGAEQPVADRVSTFLITTDLDDPDADLRAARRIDVRLQLDPVVAEAARVDLRASVALRK
jgi:prepilin-type N-terminal cleavage/methylation domain-containing protein